MQLKVSHEDGPDGIAVVRVRGDGQGVVLDASSAPVLRSILLEVIESGRLILVVDLSVLEDIDSSVLRVLIGSLTRVRVQGGTLVLVVRNEQVRKFMVDRWGDAIHTYETVESAVVALVDGYAERNVEQRCAAIVDQDSFPQEGHWYEHVSEYITVVTLMGSVNVYTAPLLRQMLVDLINRGRMFLVLDMTNICFFDSTGTGVLVGALKRVRAHNGGLALVMPSERIQKFFRITGLAKVFPVFDTVDLAIEFVGRDLGARS